MSTYCKAIRTFALVILRFHYLREPHRISHLFQLLFLFLARTNRQIVYIYVSPWWRHQMEIFSALLALCAGHSPVNSLHKGQWRGALVFSLICAWINGWVNNRETGDLGRHQTHCDVTVMTLYMFKTSSRMHAALDLCFTLKGEPGHE